MNPPMNLFRRNQIDSPADENASKGSPQADQGSNQKCSNSVYYEQKDNIHRGTDEGYVLCLHRRTDLSMVLAMSCRMGTARLVQQPSMIDVFKSISPDEADDQTKEPHRP